MTNSNEDAQEIEQLRGDIAQTRAEMSGTVEEIEERLSPGNARARLRAGVQERLTTTRRQASDRTKSMKTELSRRTGNVPKGATAGAGAGLAALGTLITVATRRQRAQRMQVQARVQRQRTAAGAATATGLAAVAGLVGMLRARRRARTVTVREVMTPDVATVFSTDPLTSAAERMADLNVGSVPVLAPGGKLAGMLTDRDIVVKAVAHGKDARVVTAGEIAEAPVVTLGADESVEQALRLMSRHAVRRLPVLEGDSLVGVVAQADLAVIVGDEEVGDVVEDISTAPGDHVQTSETGRR